MRVFENRVLSRIFGPKRDGITEEVSQWEASYFVLIPKYY
jgi:hypothetical protein